MADTGQIEGLPAGAIVRPLGTIEGLPPGAIVRPLAGSSASSQPTINIKASLLDEINHGTDEFASDLYKTGKGIANLFRPGENLGEKAMMLTGGLLPAARAAKGYYDAVRYHLDAAEDASQKGDSAGALMHRASALIPLVGPLIGDVYDKASSGDLSGAIGMAASRILQASAMAPEKSAIPNPLDIASKVVSKIPMPRPNLERMGSTVSAKTLDVTPPASEFQPALANTPREVLDYAQSKGIKLTASQATQEPFANTVQAITERSLEKGKSLMEARDAESAKLRKNVADFADRIDPHQMGTSDAEAGDHIQRDAQVAMQVARENADMAYEEAGIQQANLAGNVSRLKKFADNQQFIKQPGAAVARKVYQSPAVQAALTDIGSAPERLGNNPDIQSMRNLRTEFWEKGNDYSGNIPDSAKALYKQAASHVDDSIMDAAKDTNFEPAFRDASAQWKTLKNKYDDPSSPLYRILQQKDSAKITNDLLNRASVSDVQLLRGENMQGALQALRRQAVIDIANKGFRVSPDGLAGYSDGFLNQLFGRAATKELYLNAEIGRRMGFQLNPSGTSNVLLGMQQLTSLNPKSWIIPHVAAEFAMPRPAASFLPSSPGATALQRMTGLTRDPITGRLIRALPAATVAGAQNQ